MQVLVIEDDPTMRALIQMILENNNHEVEVESTFESGKIRAMENSIDLVLLDLGLPDGNGYDICKSMREHGSTTPVLVLSAEKETDVKVKCLEVGADDYITKPFDNSELKARVKAIFRRSQETNHNSEVLRCGELEINLINRSFKVNDEKVELTNNEFDLLVYLIKRKNEVVSLEEIAQDVWDIDFDTQTNYINVYISYLRKKIRARSEHNYIETVRTKGFIIRCTQNN
ncbi:MAG TPA: response regulator transcription factor [Balneolaceae bacterium]|nr:response regulator transcription factor [Balneolaceae bacterium]